MVARDAEERLSLDEKHLVVRYQVDMELHPAVFDPGSSDFTGNQRADGLPRDIFPQLQIDG